MDKIDKPRVVPAEGPFLHYSTDDIIYSYILASATFHPEYKMLYVRLDKLRNIKQELKVIMSDGRQDSSITRAINRAINRLDGTDGVLDEPLLLKDKLNINRQEHDVYLFREYDLKNREINYQIINADFLKEMVAVYRPYVVKIFIYLLDKMEWKRSQLEDSYVFTNVEIAKAMGYSETSSSWKEPVRIALNHLKSAGYIDWEEFYEEQTLKNGRVVPVPKKRLVSVVDVSRPFQKQDKMNPNENK